MFVYSGGPCGKRLFQHNCLVVKILIWLEHTHIFYSEWNIDANYFKCSIYQDMINIILLQTGLYILHVASSEEIRLFFWSTVVCPLAHSKGALLCMGYVTFLGYFIYCFYDAIHSPRSYVYISPFRVCHWHGIKCAPTQQKRRGGLLF